MQFGYGLNYLIGLENAVIVDVEATPGQNCRSPPTTNMQVIAVAFCNAFRFLLIGSSLPQDSGVFQWDRHGVAMRYHSRRIVRR